MTPPRTRAAGTTPPSSTGSKKTTKKAAKETASSQPATRRSASAPKAAARPRVKAPEVARRAAEQLAPLIHREPGEVTQLERTDDGWSIHVEVVELRRIPDTMDMMSLFEVTTDDDGSLEGYRRLRRYVRGVPGEE